MGVGASIAGKNNHHHHPHNEVSSHTTRSANSVRAMALKNHARQENSYIPQTQLRSKFNKSVRQVEYHGDVRKASGDDQHELLPVHIERIEEGPAIVENGGSLVQFKSLMNLNLKISLEDDNDWGKVSCFLSCSKVFRKNVVMGLHPLHCTITERSLTMMTMITW